MEDFDGLKPLVDDLREDDAHDDYIDNGMPELETKLRAENFERAGSSKADHHETSNCRP